jgi:Cof subfamily protein (haloacid dehalogenase superfamily)
MNLVFFDIDGTLAKGKDVPVSAQKAIHALRQRGDLVWICTGRALKYAKSNFHMYANGYIVSNGREGYTCCSKIYERPLTNEQMQEIRKRLDAVNAGYAFFGSGNGYYFGPEEGYAVMASVWDPGFVLKGGDLSRTKIFNFDIWFRNEDHRRQIEEQLKDIAILNPHGPHPTADVTVLGWDKGDGLRAVAKYMKVPLQNTYAFGDGMNDICMLKSAGHGIAMGNGQQEVKDTAEYVTTAIDKDGVLNGLKHYHLI